MSDKPDALSVGTHPEPICFFGLTWVNHDGGYAVRRVAVTVGSLVAIAISCLVLRFAYEGLEIAAVGGFVTGLVVVMFAVCSALAFRHAWSGYTKRPAPDSESALRGLLTIGFVGTLTAYFLRSLTEAPGETLHRTEHEAPAHGRHT
ncbi:hypothetical protein C6Y14_42905 [Streptomyces dioscori]|uniref:EamA/RhaT family transporter n=1 Tax=Streptomyces dioscori TaxID=2109333 RepID=A0A2P8PTM5_9ACTN|nr:hypothetical protein [Streptomyces dioscori]PSM37341.1 hypothetical protein C6Y14_42905 [Streptomyces dioscori]